MRKGSRRRIPPNRKRQRFSEVCLSERKILYSLVGFGLFVLLADVSFWLKELPGNTHNSPVPKEPTKRVPLSPQDEKEGRQAVAAILRKAGATVNKDDLAKLPTQQQIEEQYGPEPIIQGLEHCEAFRERVPPEKRMLGAAGMFSTGTNLVTHLLKRNCYIPERLAANGGSFDKVTKEQLGMRWQVPWGKHTPASYKTKHATKQAQEISKDDILPVVSIRNPWRWMQSMCKNPYSAKWPHFNICPHLKSDNDQWIPVSVKYGAGTENYTSLVHLWLDWYQQYLVEAEYPHLVVRMEDLTFYTEKTVSIVCECAGGRIRDDQPFQYIVESAKADSPGHDTSTGLTVAWIKYSQTLEPLAGFIQPDYEAALSALENDPHSFMDLFSYQHPAKAN